MTLFEKHLGRHMLPSEKIYEREWYVSQVLSPEQLKKRRELMNKETPKQLSLF